MGRKATLQSVQKLNKKVLTPAVKVGTVPPHTEQTTTNMRTKSLLFTAAIMAAGVVASVAQSVYSVNAVGYVNLSLGDQFSLISNPLNGTNNLLNTILPAVPDGAQLLTWNPGLQQFNDANVFIDGLGWLPDTTILNPGEGAFLSLPSPATITFVGEVPQGSLTNNLPPNFGLIASIVPQAIGIEAAGLPAADGDQVLFWNPATQGYFDAVVYIDGLGWLPEDPTPAVGQGFFYFNTGSLRQWTRTFSVN